MAKARKAGVFFLAAAILAAPVGVAGCKKKRVLGNTLRVALRQKVRTIDPAHGGDYYSNVEVARAYEGLLRYNYLKRPYEIEPALAESMPEISKDGRVYTFRIKKGVRFQNDGCFPNAIGRELAASDFVYSFNRLLDPKEASENKWLFDGKVKEVKAVDAQTLTIRLTRPNAVFLHLLTMPGASVVAREAVETYGKDFAYHPVGTGAFQLDRFSPNQIVWIKNPSFRVERFPADVSGAGEDAGKPIPFAEKVIDDVIVEDQPAWLNFMQGNHDYLMKLPKDNVAAVWGADHKPTKELRDRRIDLLAAPAADFTYVAFNMEDPAVGGAKNRYLRQAMSLAYDEAPTIEKFYLGLAARAEFLVPPGIPGYDPSFKNPFRAYDLTKARAILERNGHPEGRGIPEITYETLSDSTQRQIAEYFQRSMAQLGVKIKISVATWPELLSRIRKKQPQMFGISWLYDYPDAENGYQLLYGRNESPGPNEANYKNARYDALYEKAAPMKDGPERRKLFAKMRELAVEDVPWIFGLHRMETRLTHHWTRNYKIHAFEHNVEKYLRVDVAWRDAEGGLAGR